MNSTKSWKPLRADAAKVRARTVNALNALTGRPQVDVSRVAAIGFCFGGTMTYELALTGANIKAAVGFHSGLQVTSPGDAKRSKPRFWRYLARTIHRSLPNQGKPTAKC